MSKAYRFDQETYTNEQIMDWSELVELSKDPLCTIGAHTIGHYALAKLEEKQMRYEVSQSRKVIQSELGFEPQHFAYPYGHKQLAGQRDFDFVESLGFKTAVTTRHGVVHSEHANYMTALPRISLNGDYQAVSHVKSLLSGLPTRLMNKGSKLNVA